MAEARSRVMTVEQVEALREETERKLNPEAVAAPGKPLDMVESLERGLL